MAHYRITLKAGFVETDAHGHIMRDYDPTSGRDYRRAPDGSWMILGFATRHHAQTIIGLEEAANGADIGQGWVHDWDHGTHRMWGMPKHRRAVKVERIAQ
jgi:hypothetical protein